ncbi:pilus assembly protein TadG-related protein [Thiocystis violacea]|uniref:pilus assembly protein TadG-related protein n=1 Tax=Thiocystis violacea TaxID=13725 RepID=UPI001907E2DE|nr:pilus assembly protein TadG-related protein [Thiocystis violacea]MBK1719252.1 hypothetical protein [Thiocystis violacea]
MKTSMSHQKGASTVLWALSLVPLLGLAALAVDVNNLFVAAAELQNAADAGALEGVTHLYNEEGTTIQRGTVIAEATAAVTANLSRKSMAEVASVEIGHWRFDPGGGGQFTATMSDTPANLEGKVLYDPADPTDCTKNLNLACSGEINAVRVVAERRTTPVQSFFARVLGIANFPAAAQSVAYLGYAGSVDPGDVDQPIAICQEALVDEDGGYTCSVGRFIPTTTETGGWTSFNQDNACQGGTNASEMRPLICSNGNPEPIVFGRDMATIGGQVQTVFDDLYNCWVASTNKTQPWPMVLPVIQCNGNNPGPCNKVVGVVAVNVLYMVDQANKIEDDAPTRMIFPEDTNQNEIIDAGDGEWVAPVPTSEAPDGSEAYGILRWNSFVNQFNILGLDTNGDGEPDPATWNDNPQLNGWRQKTIYFAPDCDPQIPRGLTVGRNFGIRAVVPVLVN